MQPAHGEVGEKGADRMVLGRTGLRGGTVAARDPQPVLGALVVRHQRERGEPRVDCPELTPFDAGVHDGGERLHQLLALGPVPGERAAVTRGEAVDLVQVVGQGTQGRHVGPDHPIQLHRGRAPRCPHPRDQLERGTIGLAHDLVEQLALAAEVVVQRRLLETAPAGDLGHGGPADAPFGEQLRRRGDDLPARIAARRGAGAATRAPGATGGGLPGGDHAGERSPRS